MDAKVGDWVVTPRDRQAGRDPGALAQRAEDRRARSRTVAELLARATRRPSSAASGTRPRGCLYDVVDPDHRPGTARRDAPAQPDLRRRRPAVPAARRRARAAGRRRGRGSSSGRRSACARSRRIIPTTTAAYEGGALARDGAYHQGTVWPWLLGAFVEAWVRVRGGGADAEARGARALPRAARSPISTRRASATSPRSPTATRRTPRAAARSRPGPLRRCFVSSGSSCAHELIDLSLDVGFDPWCHSHDGNRSASIGWRITGPSARASRGARVAGRARGRPAAGSGRRALGEGRARGGSVRHSFGPRRALRRSRLRSAEARGVAGWRRDGHASVLPPRHGAGPVGRPGALGGPRRAPRAHARSRSGVSKG